MQVDETEYVGHMRVVKKLAPTKTAEHGGEPRTLGTTGRAIRIRACFAPTFTRVLPRTC